MLREMLHPTSASDVLDPRVDSSAIRASPADPAAVLSRGRRTKAERSGLLSVIGQCLHYRMARPVTERLIGPEAFQSLDLDFLTDHITSFCLAALGCIPPLNQAGLAATAGAVANV